MFLQFFRNFKFFFAFLLFVQAKLLAVLYLMCARRAKVKIVSKIRSAKILAVDTRIVPSQKNIALLRVQSPSNRGSRVLTLPKEIELDGGAFYGVELVSDTRVLGARRWLRRSTGHPPPLT